MKIKYEEIKDTNPHQYSNVHHISLLCEEISMKTEYQNFISNEDEEFTTNNEELYISNILKYLPKKIPITTFLLNSNSSQVYWISVNNILELDFENEEVVIERDEITSELYPLQIIVSYDE